MKIKKIFFAIYVITLIFIFTISFVKSAPPYYNPAEGVVYVSDSNNLSDLRKLEKSHFEILDNVCYIKSPIHVKGTLFVNENSCDIVKLYPSAYIKVMGEIYFENVGVYSYDPSTGKPIILNKDNYKTVRPHITTVSPAHYFFANNTEFAYLGYYDDSEKGSNWGLAFYNLPGDATLPGFEIINSRIHDNYFGLYTFNVDYANILNTEVFDNVEYGLDFHDYSSHFNVSYNEIYRNGNHALIFSKFCKKNIISYNVVRDNNVSAFVKGEQRDYGTHGIMLHHFSENNIVEGNLIENNVVGIYLQQSSNNVIKNNTVISDNDNGIYISESNNNDFIKNNVFDTKGYGFYSYFSDNNSFSENYFEKGIYLKGEIEDGNQVKEYSFFDNSTDYNPDAISNFFRIESFIPNGSQSKTKNFSIFGIRDRALLSKVFFIVGILVIVFVIIIVELIVLSVKRRNKK